MSGFRVDLLRPEERRYQGPISQRFALNTLAATVLLALTLLISWWVASLKRLERERDQLNAEWSGMEARFSALTNQERRITSGKALLADLKKWSDTGTPVREILADLPRVIPDGIQLTKLSAKGDWVSLKLPPIRNTAGKEVPVPPVPARTLSLVLDGRARGENGDELVVTLDRDLRSVTGLAVRCESIQVQQLRRDQAQPNAAGKPDLLFGIEAVFKPRRLE